MYELMVVAVSQNADTLLSRVEKIIKEADAKDVKVERLGRKKLAYDIKKHSEGEFFLLDFNAEAESIRGISDKLRLEQEDLLRHLLIVKKEQRGRKKSGKKLEEARILEEEKKPKVTVVTRTVEKALRETKGQRDNETKGKKTRKKKL